MESPSAAAVALRIFVATVPTPHLLCDNVVITPLASVGLFGNIREFVRGMFELIVLCFDVPWMLVLAVPCGDLTWRPGLPIPCFVPASRKAMSSILRRMVTW